MPETVFDQIKRLEMHVLNVFSAVDTNTLERHEQKLVMTIKRQLADSKLDLRDYEYAETKAEQTKLAKEAGKGLEKVRIHILAASEHNLFSAIDVALLTSQIDGIITVL